MEYVTFGETENLITPRERRKRMSAWGEKESYRLKYEQRKAQKLQKEKERKESSTGDTQAWYKGLT